MKAASVTVKSTAQFGFRLRDFLELAKPEVTSLIVLSTLAGFYLGTRGQLDFSLLLHTLLGTALVAGGTGALNQFVERSTDARMRRTAQRPLPAGRMHPVMGLAYGSGLAAAGIAYLLLLVNPLASLLALLTLASYLLLYTPLKKRTHLCTLVGAFPGAMPPLIGWAAAQNQLTLEAWVLYGILFLWQFPHFFAIAWLYRDDYARGGIIMLPAVDPSGRATFQQIVAYSALLLPMSVLPSLLGLAGTLYLWSAVLLGLSFLAVSVWGSLSRTTRRARYLLHASVLYLPALFGLLMFDKQVH
ncbi:MAG: heme o synthase [Candidatus Acidiferrales bacterium]